MAATTPADLNRGSSPPRRQRPLRSRSSSQFDQLPCALLNNLLTLASLSDFGLRTSDLNSPAPRLSGQRWPAQRLLGEHHPPAPPHSRLAVPCRQCPAKKLQRGRLVPQPVSPLRPVPHLHPPPHSFL